MRSRTLGLIVSSQICFTRGTEMNNYIILLAGLIPQILQLQAQLTLASLGRCHKSADCAKSCARRSVCFCNTGSGAASIGLFTWQLQSCD
jgi:hypothetical protein